jgi:serine/threonine-protein kinase RsbW
MDCLVVARHVRAAFGAVEDAPALMRQVVRQVLADHVPGGVVHARLYDIELAVSELVANAVEHAGSGGSVALTVQRNGAVLVEVSDLDPMWGSRSRHELGGRGLGIVDTVADRWNVDWTGTGKTVRAEFGHTQAVEAPLVLH